MARLSLPAPGSVWWPSVVSIGVAQLSYLRAALQLTNRSIGERRLEELVAIVKAPPDYDLLLKVKLDKAIDLGAGRNKTVKFRDAAASSIGKLVPDNVPDALAPTSSILCAVVAAVSSRIPIASQWTNTPSALTRSSC
ncbi:hypothetical protein [Bradyrhizobium erythrophlei]|uniref:Uncharacterized protein n=1 Tax=Bradyrhizobium erythrophlei TaxID=1437360 RepID=A0A1H4WU74_9BRAD|nr:hypothetical protein [Bradyrhizobium erythrophlei]SEC96268.1 hypothetical protein SAMN05444164_3232 [Bradyrhizobium erythrophlei]